MSYESTEDRVTKLEQDFCSLVAGHRELHAMNLDSVEASLALRRDLLALTRFISTQDAFGTKANRQPLLDLTSRLESHLEVMEKQIADSKKFCESSPAAADASPENPVG